MRCALDPEERMINNNQLMFDKYMMLQELGKGSSCTVFLVKHVSMDQDRALKLIPKSSAFSLSALSEAKLLSSLDHPSVPRIYDFEQDESFYYIVEDYIDGESLDSFLLRQKIISPGLFFNICEQLCDVFQYLHSHKPNPIIYRDLKPEHIIVCHNQIKLIDYGAASYVSKIGNNFNHYGNTDFSAPECFSDDTITEVSDIYSIGQLIKYILTFTSNDFSKKFKYIIPKATNSDKGLRFSNVSELYHEIKNINQICSQPHLYKKIAVLGSHRGCGTTHVAVAVTCELNNLGYNAAYIEVNDKGFFKTVHNTPNVFSQNNGFFYYKSFQGLPLYNEGIQFNFSNNIILLHDFGSDFSNEELVDMDLILYVCGGGFWNLNSIYENLPNNNASIKPLKVICNRCNKTEVAGIAAVLNCNVYHFPYDNDIFKSTNQKEVLTLKLLNIKGGLSPLEKLGNYLKNSIFHRK